jgi:hypothetical protein
MIAKRLFAALVLGARMLAAAPAWADEWPG